MKTSIINTKYTCILDEIPFSGDAFLIIESCPLLKRPYLYEIAGYRMAHCGASKIMFSTNGIFKYLPKSLNFGKLKTAYSHDMLLMQAQVPTDARYEPAAIFVPVKQHEIDKYINMHNEIFESIDNASFTRESDLKDCFEKSNYEIMFFYAYEKLVGICEIEFQSSQAIIDTIGIMPEFRGQGYGRMLLNNIFYILSAHGIKKALLVVSSSNKAGLSLYRSFKFKKEQTLSKWYVCKGF
ncbi:MAG: GNAT family N-acetyltransferase [Eubacteriaceae bacterium]|nr:GNAT family N-acetyltransferase [Eubacteriaceae bacterium]